MTNNGGYKLEYLEKYQGRPQKPSGNKNNPNKKPRGCLSKTLIILVQLGLIGLLFGVLAFVGAYIYLSNELSDSIDQVVAYRGTGVGGTPRFYDRNGELLFELTTTEKRLWLAYNEIPRSVVDATVAVEDDTFWTNYGFDPAAIGAALLNNYRNQDGRPVGASTITQQLVRHIAFTYEERVSVSYERKLRELFLAFIMTQQRSKEAIIQMYLNEIYYGNLAYGIEAASQTYFAKSAQNLTLAEAAFLAGLPQSPLDWDPYTNFDAAKERQEFILDLMVEDGTITALDGEIAKGVTLHIAPRITANEAAGDVTLEAAHFVLYVQNELEKLYGPDAIALGGWQITTSLDLNMQKMAETAAREQVAARAAAHNVSNASVVILKPNTGEILAMVGSLDYFDESIDGQVNVALSPRQPGSSIKPITYATALQRGWSTADVLWDVPIELDLGDGQKMVPVNYDGYYRGPVLFRDALANSYNIPPVQLLRDVGVPNFIATARSMGIESLREPPGFYGLALTLGGGEVPLLEMTHAFATLANQGQKPRLTSVLHITDSRGNVIFDAQQNQLPAVNALDPKIAYIITDILDDDQARVAAMGYNNPLELPFPAAVKTGTTNDFRDNWTIGYTPGVVVGIWMGNSDGRPMIDSSGLRAAAPLWNNIMQTIYNDPAMMQSLWVNGRPPATGFIQPQGIELRPVCLPSGTGGSRCTASRNDWFIVGAPTHGNARISYNTNMGENLGAWTLSTMSLPADEGQRILDAQPELSNGSKIPRPTECVINSTSPPAGATVRLYLPVPPFYPDEVKARQWAQSSGYRMAPAAVCPLSVIRGSSSPSPTSTPGE
ncbi:MAG: transglycosylase domain-containing protein [Ardenticatenaceae bacterium]|nr:transglycosylase domain-containing protein [Anaerolineales bacterium]MCB8976949.1 transglycosylase domain-containing protein [Ardenticatenaceae bacterium]